MADDKELDINMVEHWVKLDFIRIFAGVLAGALAGVMMLGVLVIASVLNSGDFWYPIKLAAIPILGPEAMAFGTHMNALVAGFVVHEAVCMFWGAVFAHFTFTNAYSPLLGVGLSWGAFSWIFINNLFSPAFREVFVVQAPAGLMFLACLVYGISLCSVAFFDRILFGAMRGS